jgi:hypothetical protein
MRKFLKYFLVLGLMAVCLFVPFKRGCETLAPFIAKLSAQLSPPASEASSASASAAPAAPDSELCPDETSQTDLGEKGETFSFKGYKIHQLARFSVRGVLLSKHDYSSGAEDRAYRSVLSPCDFSIGWGPMSNPTVLKNFTYFQKDRFVYYACSRRFSAEADRLHTDWHIANIHLIPANESISSALGRINPRDIVTLSGELVEVFQRDQRIWKSSMVNTATGDGACKLLFLRRVEWREHPAGTEGIPLPHVPGPDEQQPDLKTQATH